MVWEFALSLKTGQYDDFMRILHSKLGAYNLSENDAGFSIIGTDPTHPEDVTCCKDLEGINGYFPEGTHCIYIVSYLGCAETVQFTPIFEIIKNVAE